MPRSGTFKGDRRDKIGRIDTIFLTLRDFYSPIMLKHCVRLRSPWRLFVTFSSFRWWNWGREKSRNASRRDRSTNRHGLIFIESDVWYRFLFFSRVLGCLAWNVPGYFRVSCYDRCNGEGMSFLEQRYFNVRPGDFWERVVWKVCRTGLWNTCTPLRSSSKSWKYFLLFLLYIYEIYLLFIAWFLMV